MVGTLRSEDDRLIRYLVRTLGLPSDTARLEAYINFADSNGLMTAKPESSRPDNRAILMKYICVACNAVAVTMLCHGARRHGIALLNAAGKTGNTEDAKRQCKELQHFAAP